MYAALFLLLTATDDTDTLVLVELAKLRLHAAPADPFAEINQKRPHNVAPKPKAPAVAPKLPFGNSSATGRATSALVVVNGSLLRPGLARAPECIVTPTAVLFGNIGTSRVCRT